MLGVTFKQSNNSDTLEGMQKMVNIDVLLNKISEDIKDNYKSEGQVMVEYFYDQIDDNVNITVDVWGVFTSPEYYDEYGLNTDGLYDDEYPEDPFFDWVQSIGEGMGSRYDFKSVVERLIRKHAPNLKFSITNWYADTNWSDIDADNDFEIHREFRCTIKIK